ERFDEKKFFMPDLPENKSLIDSAITVDLQPGDLLLFHCRSLHAAGKNQTDKVKLSAVFSYHGQSNPPLDGTRSAFHPAIPFSTGLANC
ncbi:MAG: phytanoyl-CoA dioxygenase family protein, partial [Gammaproteobacteria bacterium]|nr:phytanoyl-CoA dioxygenase family protein [Gammaproteobacteria bacterium]